MKFLFITPCSGIGALTRPPGGRGHRIRTHRRRRGMCGLVVTQRTRGLVGQADKRLGRGGAFAPRLDGRLRLDGPPRGHGTATRPGKMEHDTEPEKSEERELIEKERRHHGVAPLHGGVMGRLSRVLGLKQLSAARRYTALLPDTREKGLLWTLPQRLPTCRCGWWIRPHDALR